MPKPQVLIVGCGAVGLSAGYFLSFGADITYLVRPGRKSAFVGPKKLYSYKDNELYTFADYRVIEDPSEVSGQQFAFVFDTLDGHTARSEGGTKTLSKVGALINEEQNSECFVTYDAVALDIDQHYATTLAISPTRLIFIASLLAHQPTPLVSIPPNADKTLIEKADILYSHLSKNTGLMAMNSRPVLVKKFKDVYEKNGRLKVQTLPTFFQPVTLVVLLHLVTWHIQGWPEFKYLRQNRELWSLLMRAQKEIFTLPRHGWTGWLLSIVWGSWLTAKLNTGMSQDSLPMQYHEFNKFHHGGKVNNQDVDCMVEVLADGEKSGHKMPALQELITKAKSTGVVKS
ncbi:ketopantoate reductase [Phaeosphaeriaceae sp. PMI808]|nr:ketopantoate reductase [Phaeosphaeriaceae sp. PMI808]